MVVGLDEKLARFLDEVRSFGLNHDSRTEKRLNQMLNITPDTGLFLSILIQSVGARRVLEVGTSNGYSTMWIADALRNTHGRVTTVEVSRRKIALAKRNFLKSGLSEYVDLYLGDIRAFLPRQADLSFDMIFMDAERPQYVLYWSELNRVLRRRGLLIADNALSPRPHELDDFIGLLKASGRYIVQILRVGKGELVALKRG